ncbi:hypothetical protein A4R26_30155 [Niastella populi]|uniref:Uncharacterized protein n=1 Tax=Niastella populi TaxID=550983 RepID=A0A1V9EV75_9BACT|nr:hypothetical protein A4R26_30155 [Niastella populi]
MKMKYLYSSIFYCADSYISNRNIYSSSELAIAAMGVQISLDGNKRQHSHDKKGRLNLLYVLCICMQ